jgi:hypothetical protein
MKPIYARTENNHGPRKIMLDMAFIVTNKMIRLPKYYMEDGLYFPYYPDKKDRSKIEKFYLDKEKAKKEDKDFYYFEFPLKAEQVEDIAS